jgi:hypothetical protein
LRTDENYNRTRSANCYENPRPSLLLAAVGARSARVFS